MTNQRAREIVSDQLVHCTFDSPPGAADVLKVVLDAAAEERKQVLAELRKWVEANMAVWSDRPFIHGGTLLAKLDEMEKGGQ